MADAVGSDYWFVYNDCSQDVPLSVWSDQWPSSVASCDPVAFSSLFDEIYEAMQGETIETEMVGTNAQLSDDFLNQDLTANYPDECGAQLLNPLSPAILAFATDERSLELPDRYTVDNYRSVVSENDATRDDSGSVTMSPNSLPEGEASADIGDADNDSCSDVSRQSSPVHDGNDCDKNNNGELNSTLHEQFELQDCCQVPCDSFSGRRTLPKRLTARRAEMVIDSFSDDDDECSPTRGHGLRTFASSCKKLISKDCDVTSTRRLACAELNKNAMNARLNRQKKKAYIASLEAHQTQLSNENTRLKSAVTSLTSERNRLAEEVNYLKAVLANDSALANLVRGIKDSCGVHLTSQFEATNRKRRQSVEADHDYTPSKVRKDARQLHGGGVCLHVQQSRLSLEFCDRCARQSNAV